MESHLLVYCHRSHWIAGVGIVSKNIENATAVDQKSVSPQNQDLGGVQRPAGQPSSVDVPESRGELDDVVPDHGLGEESRGVESVGLLPQKIVLGLGVRPCSLSVEGIHQRRRWNGWSRIISDEVKPTPMLKSNTFISVEIIIISIKI